MIINIQNINYKHTRYVRKNLYQSKYRENDRTSTLDINVMKHSLGQNHHK